MIDLLYGKNGDEELHDDPLQVREYWLDMGGTGECVIEEWSTSGFEQFVPDGDGIVADLVERACDDMFFERAADVLSSAGADLAVIAAFDKAREMLLFKAGKSWRFADKLIRSGVMTDESEEIAWS